MNKYSLNLNLSVIVLLVAIMFSSCGGTSPVKLTDEASVATLSETVRQHLPEGVTVYSIKFSSRANEVEDDMRDITLVYGKDGSFKSLFIPLGEGDVQTLNAVNPFDEPAFAKDSLPKGRTIDNFDYTSITKNVKKGKQLLKENGIDSEGTEKYMIFVYGDVNNDLHNFQLLSSGGAAAGKYAYKFNVYPFVGNNKGEAAPQQ